MNKITKITLSCTLLLLFGCSEKVNIPQEIPDAKESAAEDRFLPLAHLISPDTAGLVTLHPGQILQKVDHTGLINKPALSLQTSRVMVMELDPDDPDDQKALGFCTRLIEQPAETTGIDMNQPIHVALISLVKLEARLILRLKDSARFENFIRELLHANSRGRLKPGEVPTWIPTEGGRRVIMLEDKVAIAHDGATAMLIFHNSLVSDKTIAQLADEQLKPSGKPAPELPPMLLEQLAQSHDLGVYLNMEAMMPFLVLFMEGKAPPAHIKEMKAFLSLNSEPGRLVADLNLDFGDKNGFKLGTDPLPNEILDILPASSFIQASLSVDLATAYEKLKPILPFTEFDPEELREGLGLDIEELPEFFSGQAAFGITEFDAEDEEPSFIAAIGTKVPAAEVYTRIIQKGLLRALRGDGGDLNPLKNLSFTAKDQRLFISTKNHADILEAGKAEKPIGKEERDALRDGLFNLTLDFPALLEALPLENAGEEEATILIGIISQLQNLRLRVTQKSPSRFGIHLGLQLMDKDAQALRTLAHLGADLANPYYRNPKTRSKILEAEKSAGANPGQLAEAIIGTWSGKDEDEFDGGTSTTHYKNTLLGDGTMKYEHISIESITTQTPTTPDLNEAPAPSYSRYSYQARWTLNGTSYKEYNEHGFLRYFATILSIDDKTMTYIDGAEYDGDGITWETNTQKRTDADYKLPDPPEGLEEIVEE